MKDSRKQKRRKLLQKIDKLCLEHRLRVCQLIFNVVEMCDQKHNLFFIDEDSLLLLLEKFEEKYS